MSRVPVPPAGLPRRRLAQGLAAGLAAAASPALAAAGPAASPPFRLVCFIRYRIDPFQAADFRAYAEAWGPIIPRLGGALIGYFLPAEGTNDVAWGLIGFDSLAAYEAYRGRLRTDPQARANFAFAQARRLVLREERTFLEAVPATLGAYSANEKPPFTG